MQANEVAWVLGLVLAALLAVMVGQSLRRAFARPGPTVPAVLAYSLSTGRGMLLLAVIGFSLASSRSESMTGSSAPLVPIVGTVMLLLQIGAETRWPRQSGSVRVAMLGRATLRQIVETRYLVGVGVAGAFALGSLVFFLVIDPSVTQRPSTVCLNQTCAPDDRVLLHFEEAAPGVGALLVGAALMLLMALLGAVAIRQVLRRPMLAGVGSDVDRELRKIAAQRVLRALTTACLGLVAAMAADLQGAMVSNSQYFKDLPDGVPPIPAAFDLSGALGHFLLLVEVGCLLGALVLYQVGPSQRSMLKKFLPVPATGNR